MKIYTLYIEVSRDIHIEIESVDFLGTFRNKEDALRKTRIYFLKKGLISEIWNVLDNGMYLSEIPKWEEIVKEIEDFESRSSRHVHTYEAWYNEFEKDFSKIDKLDEFINGFSDNYYRYVVRIKESELE
jgi:hypothetical protein